MTMVISSRTDEEASRRQNLDPATANEGGCVPDTNVMGFALARAQAAAAVDAAVVADAACARREAAAAAAAAVAGEPRTVARERAEATGRAELEAEAQRLATARMRGAVGQQVCTLCTLCTSCSLCTLCTLCTLCARTGGARVRGASEGGAGGHRAGGGRASLATRSCRGGRYAGPLTARRRGRGRGHGWRAGHGTAADHGGGGGGRRGGRRTAAATSRSSLVAHGRLRCVPGLLARLASPGCARGRACARAAALLLIRRRRRPARCGDSALAARAAPRLAHAQYARQRRRRRGHRRRDAAADGATLRARRRHRPCRPRRRAPCGAPHARPTADCQPSGSAAPGELLRCPPLPQSVACPPSARPCPIPPPPPAPRARAPASSQSRASLSACCLLPPGYSLRLAASRPAASRRSSASPPRSASRALGAAPPPRAATPPRAARAPPPPPTGGAPAPPRRAPPPRRDAPARPSREPPPCEWPRLPASLAAARAGSSGVGSGRGDSCRAGSGRGGSALLLSTISSEGETYPAAPGARTRPSRTLPSCLRCTARRSCPPSHGDRSLRTSEEEEESAGSAAPPALLELVDTEESYAHDLSVLCDVFRAPLQAPSPPPPARPRSISCPSPLHPPVQAAGWSEAADATFGNVDELREVRSPRDLAAASPATPPAIFTRSPR